MIGFNDLLPSVNALACGLMAIRLVAFRRNGAGYSRSASFCAYLLIVASGTVAIRILFGEYAEVDPAETLLNIALCVAMFAVKGNVRHFIRLNGVAYGESNHGGSGKKK